MSFIKDITIPRDNPFQYDALKFGEDCVKFYDTFISKNISRPITLGLAGNWGTGKTTFLLMLKNYLETKEKSVIYVNAWKNDFYKDPLIPLLAQLLQHPQLESLGEPTLESFKQTSAILLKNVVYNAASYVTSGIVDLKAVEDELEKINKDSSDKILPLIADYKTYENLLDKFQLILGQLAKKIAESQKSPLLFIIDELDRCLPSYSLAYLERIKHILSVENIIFLISYDKRQLRSSMRYLYGPELNADEYLLRIIDYEFQIRSENAGAYFKTIFNLIDIFDGKSISAIGEMQYWEKHFEILITSFNLSYRDQQHIIQSMLSTFKTIPILLKERKLFIYTYFVGIIQLKNPELFELIEPKNLNSVVISANMVSYIHKALANVKETDYVQDLYQHILFPFFAIIPSFDINTILESEIKNYLWINSFMKEWENYAKSGSLIFNEYQFRMLYNSYTMFPKI